MIMIMIMIMIIIIASNRWVVVIPKVKRHVHVKCRAKKKNGQVPLHECLMQTFAKTSWNESTFTVLNLSKKIHLRV